MGNKRDATVIDSVVVHCAATPNGQHFTAEHIDQWHAERGFKRDMSIRPGYAKLQHIGYHYVITLDGQLHRGRPLEEVGAHAQGYNAKSIGICMVGNFEQRRPSAKQLASFVALVDWLRDTARLGARPKFTVHRWVDKNHTVCPGRYFPYEDMKQRWPSWCGCSGRLRVRRSASKSLRPSPPTSSSARATGTRARDAGGDGASGEGVVWK